MEFPRSPVKTQSPRRYQAHLFVLMLLVGLCTFVPAQAASAKTPDRQLTQPRAESVPGATGSTVAVSVGVKNPSSKRRGATRVKLYLVGKSYNISLGRVRVPGIRAGRRVMVEARKRVPAGTSAGRYAVRVCLGSKHPGHCRTSVRTLRIAPARLDATPTVVSFGNITSGSSSRKQRVRITNTGQTRSGALDTSLRGSSAISVNASTCRASLTPGASCDMDLTFSPTAAGHATGILMVTGRTGGTTTVPLTGTGRTRSALSISEPGHNFGYDDTPSEHTFTITNRGESTASVPAVTVTGDDAFAVTSNTCTTTLAKGASCVVGVTYEGTGTAQQSARLKVSGTPGGTVLADLAGSPVAFSVAPADHDFGGVGVGARSEAASFVLTNHRLTPVTVDETVSGPFAAGTSCDEVAVPAGAVCPFTAVFTPTAGGSVNGTIGYGSGGDTADANLTGVGLTPAKLSIDQAEHDFGYDNSPDEHRFTITNDGNLTTAAPTASVTGDAAFSVTTDTCTTTLAKGASCVVGVTYEGTGTAQQSAQLKVSATPGGTVTADLAGSPVALSIAPTEYDFGGVDVGVTSDAASFALTNHRLTPVTVDETVSGPFAAGTSCDEVTVPAGGTCAFTATFTPIAGGSVDGSIAYGSGVDTASADLTGAGSTAAALSISASATDIGAYEVAGAPGTTVLTVTNTGTKSTGIVAVDLDGSEADFAVQSSTCPAVLLGGSSCTVTMSFAPLSNGEKTATVTVSGAAGGSITLTGLGAPAGVSIVPALYDFGSQTVGISTTKTFRVVNTGETGAVINSVSSANPFGLDLPADFTCVLSIDTIAPHRSCTISIAFRPTWTAFFTGTLTAGGDFGSVNATMNGTGVPAAGRAARAGGPTAGQAGPTKIQLIDGKPVVNE